MQSTHETQSHPETRETQREAARLAESSLHATATPTAAQYAAALAALS